jgi:hypothetical protein
VISGIKIIIKRYKEIIFLSILMIFAIAIISCVEKPTITKGRAIWVWYDDGGIDIIRNTNGARCKFFKFCEAPHGDKNKKIKNVFIAARDCIKKGNPDEKNLECFLIQAKKRGLRVEYLTGAAEWVKPNKIINGFQKCIDFLDFNERSKAKFDGLHFDVEPHQLEEWNWKNQDRIKKYWRNYRLLLDVCQYMINNYCGPNVSFSCDIPRWYDTKEELKEAIKEDHPNRIIQDIVDYVVVMDCLEAEDISDEIDYGNEIDKGVFIGLDTKSDEFNSINEIHNPDYIFGNISKEPSFLGFAIHEYESYKKLKYQQEEE